MKEVTRRQERFLLRLVVASLGPLVLAVAVQAIFTMVMQRREMTKGLEAKASSLAELMVNVTGPSLALDDPKAVQDSLAYVETDPDFAFCLALGPDGRAVAYRARAGADGLRPKRVGLVTVPEVIDRGEAMVAAVPVRTGGQTVGAIYLGLSTATVKAETLRMSFWATLISLAGVLIATSVVWALARKIVARNRDMGLLLDHVDQGFVTLSAHGVLQAERSAVATTWLGPYQPGQKFWDALARIDPAAAAWFETGWLAIDDGVLPLEVTIDQLAKRARFGDRTLQIECKPLLAGNKLSQVLVVLSDITSELARERAEALERDLLRMLERMSRDRSGFLEFLDDANDLVHRIGARMNDLTASGGDPSFARDVHTLKGNAALFGVSTVATACQRIEDSLADRDVVDAAARTAELTASWEGLQVKLRSLFGDHKNLPEIDPADLEELEGLLVRGAAAPDVTRLVASWRLEPAALRLGRAVHQIRYLAWRLGKGEVDIKIESNRVRLHPTTWQPFWRVFAHVLRNAVDHGIESPDERRAAGKGEGASIWLRTFKQGDRFVIEVEDDGRGIDWDKVRARAQAAGVPVTTEAELKDALFDDGLSTAGAVSEVSGRGVGLAAVRAECRKLGGEVDVVSTAGKGTRFRFTWPQHVMARATPLKTAA